MPASKDTSQVLTINAQDSNTVPTRQNRIPELLLSDQFSEVIPKYRPRISQLEMALEVERALSTKTHLIVEAGAGSGKTLAYLLPVLLNAGRTLIATATHTLQQQMKTVLDGIMPIVGHRSVVIMKGRSNYVCPRKLLNPELGLDVSVQTMMRLRKLQAWWPRSESGDLTEFVDAHVDERLQEIVTCLEEDCEGSSCSMIERCPLKRLQERVHRAEIVIGNHHLLAGMSQADPLNALSGFDHIVVDEAHRFPEVVAGSQTLSLSSDQLRYLITEVVKESRRTDIDYHVMLDAAASLEHAVVAAADDSSETVLYRIVECLQLFGGLVDQAAEQSFRFRDLGNRVAVLNATLRRLLDAGRDNIQRDEARRTGFYIRALQDSVSGSISRMVSDSGASWAFTSATLAINGTCDQFQQATGMQNARTTIFASEYDYANQVNLWIPDLPHPSESSHIPQLIHSVLPMLGQAPTLMLFCSKRAMDEAAAMLAGFDGLLVQGRMSRQALVEAFSVMDTPVLLATQTFREGMDLADDRLRLLVLDKLPFPNISDLDVQIRMSAMTMSGKDSFRNYILPEAVIALRQSFGRLIRRERQRGLFVLGDPRVRSHDYGSEFLHSLPSMPILTSNDEASVYFQDILREPSSS